MFAIFWKSSKWINRLTSCCTGMYPAALDLLFSICSYWNYTCLHGNQLPNWIFVACCMCLIAKTWWWQGWLELASARHSMGSSRVSTVLLDLKVQSASTTCGVTDSVDGSPSGFSWCSVTSYLFFGTPRLDFFSSHVLTPVNFSGPHFTLLKWVSSKEGKCYSGVEGSTQLQMESSSSQLRRRGLSHISGMKF